MSRVRRSIALVAAASATLGFFACGEPVTGLRRAGGASSLNEYDLSDGYLWTDPTLWYRRVWVCASGASGTFRVAVDSNPASTQTVGDDRCKVVHYNAGSTPQSVTVTWLDSVSGPLDSIVPDSTHSLTRVRLSTQVGSATRVVTTTGSKGGILAFHAAPASVPAVAPDSIPSVWRSTSRIAYSPSAIGIPIYRELLVLRFAENTSVAARTALVAAVGGTVIGGAEMPEGEGLYVVRVPDDTTGAAVRSAVDSLRSQATIELALPMFVFFGSETYQRPNEGVGLKKSDWILDQDSAFINVKAWAASAVGAPYAWTCGTGAGQTIAIIDYGISANTELAGRVASTSIQHPAQPLRKLAHGQRVAAVAAARAGNDTGMAGVAFDASVLLLDLATYTNGVADTLPTGEFRSDITLWLVALDRVRLSGARVLNVSLGTNVPISPAVQASDWEWWAPDIARRLTRGGATPPVIVVSAGNQGSLPHSNAQSGAWGALRNDATLNSVTIAVSAASYTRGAFAPDATEGGVIDLVAPGHSVPVFDGTFALDTATGSSFATPMVAGAAALLLSMDSSLTHQQVRDILTQTADSGIRAVHGRKFLDIAAAARRVASRRSSSLCGNRVWADDANDIYASRTGGAQWLFRAGTTSVSGSAINVYRGGRHIESPVTRRAHQLQGGSWGPGPYFGDDSSHIWSPSFRASVEMTDHDERFYSRVDGTLSTGSSQITLRWLRAGRGQFASDSTVVAPLTLSLAGSVDSTCMMRFASDSSCVAPVLVGSAEYVTTNLPAAPTIPYSGPVDLTGFPHALDPRGRFVVVPIAIKRRVLDLDAAWIPCPGILGWECRPVLQDSIASVRTLLVRIRADASSAEVLTTSGSSTLGAGDEVYFSSISMDGTEMMLQTGASSMAGFSFTSCTNARYLWLSLPTGSSVAAPRTHHEPASGSAMCLGNLWASGGVFDRPLP